MVTATIIIITILWLNADQDHHNNDCQVQNSDHDGDHNGHVDNHNDHHYHHDDHDHNNDLLQQLILPPLALGLESVQRLSDVVNLIFH